MGARRMTHREKDELIFGLALLIEKLSVALDFALQYPSLPAPLVGEAPPSKKIGTP